MPEPTIPTIPSQEDLEKPEVAVEFYKDQLRHARETILWGYELLSEGPTANPLGAFGALVNRDPEELVGQPPKMPEKPDTMPEDLWRESTEWKRYTKQLMSWTEEAEKRLSKELKDRMVAMNEQISRFGSVHNLQQRFMIHSTTAKLFLEMNVRDLMLQVWSQGDGEDVPMGPGFAQTMMFQELMRPHDPSAVDPARGAGGPLSRIESYLAALLQTLQRGSGGGGIIRA